MSILKLRPACKDYLWGGHRLVDEYNVDYEGDILAEAWELSCHPDGPSMIMNGPYEGKSLRDYLEAEGMTWKLRAWKSLAPTAGDSGSSLF